jgi:diacylglycerol kinase family enzyme
MPENDTLRVAIILNGNARSVEGTAINLVQSAVTDEAIFISHSEKEFPKIARQIVDGGFDVVLCGGGDGTFSRCVTDILNIAPGKPPAFGVLRLGTGNGVAEALKVASPSFKGISAELRQAKDPAARITKTLVKIGNRYAPFAGTGLDAWVLSDYNFIKETLNKIPFIPKKNRGPLDYALAVTMFSAWRLAFSPLPKILIRNGGGKAYRIDFHGEKVGDTIRPGEILFNDSAAIVSASTIPYYGWGVRLFPQVNSLYKNYFQLRVSGMRLDEALFQLPALFLGTMEHEKIWDFACQDITIEVDDKNYPKGIPLQISGDAMGKKKQVRIELAKIQAVLGSAAAAPDPIK